MALKILKYVALVTLGLALLSAASILVAQRVSDGPIEPMQGGPFKTGEIVEGPVTDWSFGVDKRVEFELEGFGTSRVAGYIMHDGVAYMTCDLGYIWNRLPDGRQKDVLRLIYTFKHWHTDAVEDGRARLRIEGKIYETQFVKVEDEALNAELREVLVAKAREYFAPDELPGPPASPPDDIWFFRMEPRS